MTLPAMVNNNGEVVRLVTAGDLLEAAGLTDLREAEVEQLASFKDGTQHLKAIAREADSLVDDEFVRRRDRRTSGTWHVGGFTITVPSPEAGAVKYDDEALAAAVDQLVEADLIDPEAAVAAIEWYSPPPPAPYWKQSAAGIKALLKLGPVVREAVESARVEVEPARRVAKVKRAA